MAVLIVAALFASPFYWMIISALRPLDETIAFPAQLVPGSVSLDNFQRLLGTSNFGGTLLNSAIVASVTAVGAALLCSMAGYAFAMFTFRGSKMIFRLIVATMLIPFTVVMVPTFFIVVSAGLVNTWWALILPAIAPAIGVFWMRQYIRSVISVDMLNAARIDGAGELRIYGQVVLPLIGPGIASLAVFVAVASWNDFVLPFLYLSSPDLLTFPPRLVQFFPNAGQFQTPYDLVMAGAVLGAIPLLILFVAFQRYFVPGVTFGSRK